MSRTLLRILGIGFGLGVLVGNTIGAGILRTPGDVAARLPHPALFLGVWIAGALYAFLGANILAELGTAIPRSGGQYVFAQRALGDFAGFIVGWSDWLSTCGATAAVAMVIGEYSGLLAPRLAGSATVIACGVVIFFALIQWRGTAEGSRAQIATSLLKAAVFAALIIACFALPAAEQAARPLPVPVGLSLLAAVILSLQAVIFTFDGWTGPIYFSEEMEQPARDIPRAMFQGLLAVTVIYLLVNAAFLKVLPISAFAGQPLAAGTAANAIFGDAGTPVILILTILSMLSAVNAYQMMAPRVLFAMSRDGLFTQQGAAVNAGGTPSVALGISSAIAVVFIATGTFQSVVALLAFFFVANYTLSFIAYFVLRRREPELVRPYRARGAPYTTVLALVGSVAFLAGAVATDTRNSIHSLVLLAISYPVFAGFRKWNQRKG